jgi:hypothetical protein
MGAKLGREDAIKHYSQMIKKAKGYHAASRVFRCCAANQYLNTEDLSNLQGMVCSKRDNPFKKNGGERK